MNGPRIRLATLVAVMVVAAGVWIAARHSQVVARERARLHAHFAQVLDELAERDVSSLSSTQQAARQRLVALLRDYDRRGRFPRNEGHAPGRTPIFVDRHGTRCAMAHLIEHAGGVAFVARIAATKNLARIHDLSADMELRSWLANAGLSLDEAARIQPEYGGNITRTEDSREDYVPDEDVMVTATLLSVGLGVPAIFANLGDRSWPAKRQAAVLALIVGAQGLTTGLIDATHDGHLRGTGYAQLVTGACALTLGLMNLRDGARADPAAGRGTPAALRPELALRAGPTGDARIALALRF